MASIADLLGVQWDQNSSYRLHPHAAKQATVKGFAHSDVLDAANNPAHTYPNGRYEGQMRHVKNGIVAVVEPDSKTVRTVYADQVETDLRPDQKDEDALAYGRGQKRRINSGGRR